MRVTQGTALIALSKLTISTKIIKVLFIDFLKLFPEAGQISVEKIPLHHHSISGRTKLLTFSEQLINGSE